MLYIYAFKTIIFDQNIKNNSANLVIIGPQWQISKYVTIDLSGLNGVAHYPEKPIKSNNYGAAGIHGLPGIPGKSSGTFFGVGDEFVNIDRLTIKTNGGNGSNGQNGGDGVDGNDGDNAGSVIRSNRLIDSYTTDYGLMFCFKRTVEIYKNMGIPGGQGGDGGMGGKAGIGGKHGFVKIINNNGIAQSNYKIESKDGINGLDGKPGIPGQGGKNGNNKVDRYDTRDEVWVRRDGWIGEYTECVNTRTSDGNTNPIKNIVGQIMPQNINLVEKESIFSHHVREYVKSCNKTSNGMTKVLLQSFYDTQQNNQLFNILPEITSVIDLSGDMQDLL